MPAKFGRMNTDKKNQHYIPKFYLRNFSFDGNKKQIGVFHLNSSFFYQKAKLKTQGSKNFFYGHDGIIEDRLADIEGLLASLIREITETNKVPKKFSSSHLDLLTFVAVTHLRNPVAIENIRGSREAMKKHLLELDPKVDLSKLTPEITHDSAIKLALSGLKQVVDNIADLEFKLLINKTKIPFISSDFPIVKYNRFLELKKWKHGKTGYGNIGLQIFIPFDPKTLMVFFDPQVYKVGFKKRKTHEIISEKDIDKINELQIINCFETLYFNENISETYIRKLVRNSAKYQKANQTRSSLSYLLEDGEKPSSLKEKKKNLVVMGTTDCQTNLEITGIKIHSGSQKIDLTSSIALMRPIPRKLMEERH